MVILGVIGIDVSVTVGIDCVTVGDGNCVWVWVGIGVSIGVAVVNTVVGVLKVEAHADKKTAMMDTKDHFSLEKNMRKLPDIGIIYSTTTFTPNDQEFEGPQ